jgi:hypothetical protein
VEQAFCHIILLRITAKIILENKFFRHSVAVSIDTICLHFMENWDIADIFISPFGRYGFLNLFLGSMCLIVRQ